MRRPRLTRTSLRLWIVVTILLLSAAAATSTAFVAYQIQSDDVRERFTTWSSLSFAADLNHLATTDQASSNWERAWQVDDFLSSRYGVQFALYDFGEGSRARPRPAEDAYPADSAIAGFAPIEVPVAVMDRALATPAFAGVTPAHLPGPNSTYVVLGGLLRPGLVLVEFYDARDVDTELAGLRSTLTWLAAGIAATGVLIGLLVAALVNRPIKAVTKAAHRLGAGELDVRLRAVGTSETADLAHSFNRMADRVRDAITQLRAKEKQQRQLLADVAHDLRTPLATILAAAEAVGQLPVHAQARALHLLTERTRRLATLVDDLLEISRLDAGVAELHRDRVDLGDLVISAADLVAPSSEVQVTGTATLQADPRRVFAIVSNLIDNALRHGAPPVDIRITASPDEVSIRCQDSGPGVPEESLATLFDRFVRADRGREASGGSGLGLAIAQANARLHGGRITVANTPDGACFTVVLPVIAE
ncbi:sensor histidine kinase [Amycolatopsis suaedae]|uniref:histidine kinase n=1 Tax=Amycolatopsis suaedae TaxID=2510978 RepID=A0A4Q7JBS5_9PSEU|nr:HAMP domain-containing sensor histidine kinase [Amycolatopsis suaedae]RZQ64548.1 HAMP domain-containing histidine kinase [Amycolatopsis suaedae]